MTASAMERLAAANPVRDQTTDNDYELFERLTRSPCDPALLLAPARRRATRRSAVRPAAVFVSALVVAVAVAVMTTLSSSPETAAASVLHHAAARLAKDPRPTLPAGAYWYVRTREASGGTSSFTLNGRDRTSFAISTRIDENWVANDGSGATYGTFLSRRALTDAGRRALGELRTVQPDQPTSNGMILAAPKLIAVPFGNQSLTPANLSNLPDNETALKLLLQATQGGTSHDATKEDIAAAEFAQVATALFYMPFDPTVSSALYRMLATIPGVQNLGQASDALGRTGVQLAVNGAATRETLLIDPNTGKALERSEIKTAGDSQDDQIPIGSTTSRETIIATGIVPGIAIRPNHTHLDTSRWTVCKPRTDQAHDLGAAHCTDPK